jgi:hypothetical protein
MSRTFRRTITGTADALTAIALAQTTAGAGDLVINGTAAAGGVATLPLAAPVALVSAANLSAITFTVYGTDRTGSLISESLAGPNATTTKTVRQFLTVTRISVSAAVGTNVNSGISAPFYSGWMPFNQWRTPFNAMLRTKISGTVNYDLEATLKGVMLQGEHVGAADSFAFDATNFTAKTADSFGALTTQVQAIRIKLNSGTGLVGLDAAQAGE